MSTVATGDERSRTGRLARLSPLVLVAVAMPWILKWAIVETVSQLAPAYAPLLTEGIGDAALYPVVTGSVTILGLYVLLDPETRRSLFLFRRPSRRELLATVAAVLAVFVLVGVTQAAVIAAFDVDPASGPEMDFGISSIVTFVIVGCVFAPIVEEVLFRGLLLGYLIDRGVPTLAAGGVVVAAFGAIHHYGGIANVASAAVLGAILVALRLRHDNLVLPVLAHSLNNLIAGILIPFFLLT